MEWNLRDEAHGAGGMLAGLQGSWLEFSNIPNGNDPRPSIQQRYPDREVYLSKYADAVLDLAKQRYLLDEDAMNMLGEAAQRDFRKQ